MSGDADELDVMLARAGRALRDEVDGASEHANRTRARVLATGRARAQRTTWAIAAAAVLAMGIGAPTVWAWSTGRIAEWMEAGIGTGSGGGTGAGTGAGPGSEAQTETESEPEVESGAESGTGTETEPEPEAESAPETETEAETEAETGTDADADTEADAESATGRLERGSAVEGRASAPIDPAERLAYREAHTLHFEARDPAGALAAWERYLDAYPRGRFALEAEYNRALCLVRLGRRHEALGALAPFAEGAHRSYRQREAARLLEALGE